MVGRRRNHSMSDALPLHEFIKIRRGELGYKKMEFANLLNIGDGTLRSWERGRFIPAGINRRNLVKRLKMTKKEKLKYFGESV